MSYHWQKPTKADMSRGILAWHVHTTQVWTGHHHVTVVQPCPYREINLLRRLARGDDMPDFETVNQPAPDSQPDNFFDVDNDNWKQQLNDYNVA